MTEQGTHDPGMRDDGDVRKGRVERGGERLCAGIERGDRFAARRGETENIVGPGVELFAVDRVPALAFPGAKVDFAETGVDPDALRQCLSEAAGALQRAAEHRNAGGERLPQFACDRIDLDAIDVELSVADTRFDQRTRMPDQENLHSRPQ